MGITCTGKRLIVILENLMQDALESVNKVILNSGDAMYTFKYILKLILAKAWYICDATLAILDRHESLYPEAYAMTRVLLEYYISIQYMYKIDPIALSERFYRYSDVAGLRLREGWATSSGDLKKRFDMHPKSAKQKQEVESYMYDYGDNKRNRQSWSGKSIEQMADCINERFLYDRVYRYLCKYVHPESLILMHDLHMQNDDIVIKRKVNQEDIDRVVCTCVHIFSSIYGICNDVFDLKKEEELKSINIEVASLEDEKKIQLVIEHNKCPYCGESTSVRNDADLVLFAGTNHERTFCVFRCKNSFCVDRFYISKQLFDELHYRSNQTATYT